MAYSVFLKRGDQVNGPLTIEDARNLIQKKKLRAGDQISQSADGPWERLGDVYKLVLSGQWQNTPETSPGSIGEDQFQDLAISELVSVSDDLEVAAPMAVPSAPVAKRPTALGAQKNEARRKESMSKITDLLPMAGAIMFVVVALICVGFVVRLLLPGVKSERGRSVIVTEKVLRDCPTMGNKVVVNLKETGPLKTGHQYEGDYIYTGDVIIRHEYKSPKTRNFTARLKIPSKDVEVTFGDVAFTVFVEGAQGGKSASLDAVADKSSVRPKNPASPARNDGPSTGTDAGEPSPLPENPTNKGN